MSTIDTILGIVVLTPIVLGLWLGLRAIVGIRVVRWLLVVGLALLLVNPRMRLAIPAVPALELLCAVTLTAAIVVLHGQFGGDNRSDRRPVTPPAETQDSPSISS